MSANPRGYAIIVCNYEYPEEKDFLTSGPTELYIIENLFRDMHFEPIRIVNKSHDLILSELKNISRERKFLSKHDSLVIYVYSRGEKDGFLSLDSYGKNVEIIKYDEVIDIFSDQRCYTLIGKPKLFFFNCSREG